MSVFKSTRILICASVFLTLVVQRPRVVFKNKEVKGAAGHLLIYIVEVLFSHNVEKSSIVK